MVKSVKETDSDIVTITGQEVHPNDLPLIFFIRYSWLISANSQLLTKEMFGCILNRSVDTSSSGAR